MTEDVYTLPPDLPVPDDDGAADHLVGMMVPQPGEVVSWLRERA